MNQSIGTNKALLLKQVLAKEKEKTRFFFGIERSFVWTEFCSVDQNRCINKMGRSRWFYDWCVPSPPTYLILQLLYLVLQFPLLEKVKVLWRDDNAVHSMRMRRKLDLWLKTGQSETTSSYRSCTELPRCHWTTTRFICNWAESLVFSLHQSLEDSSHFLNKTL